MHKRGPITIAIFSFFITLPRALFIIGQLSSVAFPFIVAWNVAQWWNSLDKNQLLSVFRDSLRHTDSYVYIAIVILFAGVIFFVFKKYQQFWYGVFETLVAIVGCFITAQVIRNGVYQTPSANVILFQGFTAIYLLVRGLSNINEGKDKPFFLQDDYKRFVRVYTIYVDLESQYMESLREGKSLRGGGDEDEES